jgi:hypothetical protein
MIIIQKYYLNLIQNHLKISLFKIVSKINNLFNLLLINIQNKIYIMKWKIIKKFKKKY